MPGSRIHFQLKSFAAKRLILFLIFLLVYSVLPVGAMEGDSIHIPAIEVEAPIVPVFLFTRSDGVETWEVSHLYQNVGHLEGTAYFGQGGNVVLAAHSAALRGGRDVFFDLHTLNEGDEILIRTGGGELRYIVHVVTSVHKRDISVIMPTNDDRLTLMASDLRTPYHNGVYDGRVIVIAFRQ